jgi:hypothetical protein
MDENDARSLAELIRPHLEAPSVSVDERGWVDSRGAAAYLGMSYNAFKKYQQFIPSRQDRPGGKRWW